MSLTRAGLWLLIGACTALLLAVALRSTEWLAWPVLAWALLAWAYLQHQVVLEQVERGRVAVWLEPADGGERLACVRGQTPAVRLRVHNRTLGTLHRMSVRVPASAGCRWDEAWGTFTLPGRAGHAARGGFRAIRTGRWPVRSLEIEIADLLGLFVLRSRVAVDLRVVIVPGPPQVVRSGAAGLRAQVPTPDGGPDAMAARGDGSELRELRAYTTADAYSRIAWKASARTGQLMVREHEDEVPGTAICVLDTGSTMRGGAGAARLEYAFDVVAAVVARSVAARDRVGVVAFDDARVGQLGPSRGAAQAQRVMALLVALATLPSPGLDEGDEDEVFTAIAAWARRTLRLDFRTLRARRALVDDGGGTPDTQLLQHWISSRRGEELARHRHELMECGVLTSGLSDARLLASIEQIPLGLRTTPRLGSKEGPLAAAIRDAAAMARDPARIVVVSDLGAVLDPSPVAASVAGAIAARHQVGLVVPFVPAFEVDPGGVGDPLRTGFTWAEREERMRVASAIRAAGAEVVVVGPTTSPAEAVRAVSRRARGGRPTRR